MKGKWFFILLASTLGLILAFKTVWAYPLPGTSAPTTSEAAFSSSSFDFGVQFQNLFSPFTSFFDNLLHESTSINTNGATTSVTLTPNVKLDFESAEEQFDDWIYANTNIRPSEVFNRMEAFIKSTLQL